MVTQWLGEEEDTCMSYEEEDTCGPTRGRVAQLAIVVACPHLFTLNPLHLVKLMHVPCVDSFLVGHAELSKET